MKNIWFKRRYRGVELSTNPTSRTRINSDNEDNEKATIKIFGHHREIKLVNLRMILVFMNLIVLAASFVSYLAWMDAKYNWQLENTDRPDRRILAAIEYLPALSPSSQKIVASVHGHLDQLLYLTAFNMFLYWVIYGFVISCRFGGTCDICTIVVSLPHSIIMIVWEIGIASAILRVHTIFSSLPWKNLAIDNSQHYKDLRYVHDFYSTWGPWIVTLYFLSVPVQIFLMSLPFLVSRLPFQEKYQQSLEMTPQAASEINMTETTESEHKVKKKRQSFVKLLTFPGTARIHRPVTFPGTARIHRPVTFPDTARIHRPGDLSNSVVERKGLNNSYPSTTTTTTNHQTSLSGDFRQNNSRIEYIEETQDPSLLANKSKKRYKHFATQQYDCACKAISAGKAVIETMGRTYHVHNSSRPLWNLLEKPVIPHYRLAGRDFLAGGVSIYENYPPRNYLNMASPPPPYSLHPRADYVNLAVSNKEEEQINMENKDNNDSYVSIDLHHHDEPQFQADLYCQDDFQGQDLDLEITHGNHENSKNGQQTSSANHFIQSVCCTINHSQHASCTNHHGSQHANYTNLHGSEQDFDEHLEQLGGQQDWSETSIII